MQTIFCLVAAWTLQSGNEGGKELKRSKKLFSFQKHFTSDKVTIMKLFCFVAKAATWIWLVFLRPICTERCKWKSTLLARCRFPCGLITSRPPERSIVDRKTFSNFCFRFPTWRKVFPSVHANALNFNHENIIIKNTTEVRGIKSFQTSIKCQPDMNRLGCLAFRHLRRNESFKNK